jgi:hypothetical protein
MTKHWFVGFLQCDSQTDYKQGGYTARWQGLSFVNSWKRILWTPPFKELFWDIDGSLTGYADGWTTPYYKWNEWEPACVRVNGSWDNGLICDSTVVLRRLQINSVNPSQLDFQSMIIDSSAGSDLMPFRPKEIYGWVAPIVSKRSYNVRFKSLIDWQTMQIR